MDVYIGLGIYVFNEVGEEVIYVNIWMVGKGVDLLIYNYGQDLFLMMLVFVEIYWIVLNGMGVGGMYEMVEFGVLEWIWYLV